MKSIRQIALPALIAFDVLVVALIALWLIGDYQTSQSESLRGSKPPTGQTLPDLRAVNLEPPVLNSNTERPTLMFVSCLQCPSGEVIGSFLWQVGVERLRRNGNLMVVGWGGSPEKWKRQHRLPANLEIHMTSSQSDQFSLRKATGVGESGVAFLGDSSGNWVSTFHLGQLVVADVLHDLKAVG